MAAHAVSSVDEGGRKQGLIVTDVFVLKLPKRPVIIITP